MLGEERFTALASLKFGESFMDIAAQFNLHAKTKNELEGLYITLFNKLADRKISTQKMHQTQLALNMVKNIISSDTISTLTLS
jgi:hypothetical protein